MANSKYSFRTSVRIAADQIGQKEDMIAQADKTYALPKAVGDNMVAIGAAVKIGVKDEKGADNGKGDRKSGDHRKDKRGGGGFKD